LFAKWSPREVFLCFLRALSLPDGAVGE